MVYKDADSICSDCDEEECCEVESRTCRSTGVMCGYGWNYKADWDVPCSTCQDNDPNCCVRNVFVFDLMFDGHLIS